jgi:DNA-binding MarR family transcriptional regulator/ribosomal protein S18 acetylase RimI-like enzyme
MCDAVSVREQAGLSAACREQNRSREEGLAAEKRRHVGRRVRVMTRTMGHSNLDRRVDTVRRFNRFYTREIGVLPEGYLDSPFSLTEGRVLYELAHREKPTASDVCASLGLDAGYLSRILSAFEKRGLVEKTPSASDGRQSLLALTEKGWVQFTPLESRSNRHVSGMLAKLSESQQRQLIGALQTIEKLLARTEPAAPASHAAYLLRPHQPGDMGWIVYRQGLLYFQEYGYDERFEALCAEIVAKFIQNYDAKRERCWIAEKDGEIVGSVFLVAKSKTVAKLRLLYVEAAARGLGIGSRLVAECVRFARQAGYKKIVLWTQSELDAARHIYKKAGFRVVGKKKHFSFNKHLVAETWELSL